MILIEVTAVDARGKLVVRGEERTDFSSNDNRNLRDAKILIIDACIASREAIAGLLGGAGFRNIAVAGNGQEGLDEARTLLPDMIITDLVLPDLKGAELCRSVRCNSGLSKVLILVMTMREDLASRAEVVFAGATDIITKPINNAELLGRVCVHLDRQKLVAELTEFRERMSHELEQARMMQESLLPAESDIRLIEMQYPVDLASYYESSTELGGDIWGVDAIDKARLRVFCGDFSGHGVGAALNTFRLHSFVLSKSNFTDEAATWLVGLNRFLCDVLPIGQFATMFCGIVDFEQCTLTYASAGAPGPIVRSGGSGAGFQVNEGTGFPLGMNVDATYHDRIVPFGPGSTLFLYSDALIEAPSMHSPVFTANKLCAFLDTVWRTQGGITPLLLQGAVLKQLRASAPAKIHDDLTIVALCHRGVAQ